MADDKDKKDDKKKEAKPSTNFRISHTSDYDEDGLTITIYVKILPDRLENGTNIPIRFFNPSNFKTLDAGYKNSGTKGETSYKLKIPINKIIGIMNNQGGKKKIGIEITSKKGLSGKEVSRPLIHEFEIEIKLPAGGYTKGVIAWQIREKKNLGEIFKAVLLSVGFIAFIALATGPAHVNTFFAFIVGAATSLWWMRKHGIKALLKSVGLFATLYVVCYMNPHFFLEPIITSIVLACFFGCLANIAEELFRKPNGDAVKNFYPWYPIKLGVAIITLLLIAIVAEFFPNFSEVAINDINQNDIVFKQSTWVWLNSIPFFQNVDFYNIIGKIKAIFTVGLATLILLCYGGLSEVIEWIKQKQGKLPSTGETISFTAILGGIWNTFGDLIMRFLPIGKRRR